MGFRKHDTIKHSDKVYVRGNVHTNTVEGLFGLLKRGIIGSFHHVSKGHLHRYVDEFSFRGMSLQLLKFSGGSVDDYAICRSS
jgi:ISXO2-like transposase domain